MQTNSVCMQSGMLVQLAARGGCPRVSRQLRPPHSQCSTLSSRERTRSRRVRVERSGGSARVCIIGGVGPSSSSTSRECASRHNVNLSVLPEVRASDARCCQFELPAHHLEARCTRAVAERVETETREQREREKAQCLQHVSKTTDKQRPQK